MPPKTEEDPLDPKPPIAQRASLAAIRCLEQAVLGAAPIEGMVLRYGSFYGLGASDQFVELIKRRKLPVVPIVGQERVGRLLIGLGQQARDLGVDIQPAEVNGQPGARFLDPAGRLVNVFALDVADGVVQTVRSIINRDKLRHLGPLADVRELLRRRKTT